MVATPVALTAARLGISMDNQKAATKVVKRTVRLGDKLAAMKARSMAANSGAYVVEKKVVKKVLFSAVKSVDNSVAIMVGCSAVNLVKY